MDTQTALRKIKKLLNNVLEHISNVSNNEINAKGKQMKDQLLKYLKTFSDDPEVEKIDKALRNILNSEVPDINTDKCQLFQNNIKSIFSAIEIFTNLMNQLSNISRESLDIERKLFSISFNPSDENNLTYILPVFLKQFIFLTTKSFYLSLESSTGSGKTRVTPFIFAIMSFCNKLSQPFIFMIQPRYSIISEKIKDFKNILGDSVYLISNQTELEKFYGKKFEKPILALFTPRVMIKVLVNAENQNYHLIKKSRFILDEVHERSIETDVLIALLSKKMKIKNTMQLLMMTATPDDRLYKSFDDIENIPLPNACPFKIDDRKQVANNFGELDNTVKDSTMNIIQEMVDKKIDPGHILIFTSGNRRINNLMNNISISITQLSETNKKVKLLKKCENFMKDKQMFINHIEDVLLEDEDSKDNLYFIIMKYAGFLSNELREIAKSPISDYPNVIKIIISTNSIESSITIDGLAAVVDSGICNAPRYDKEVGITILEESPISIQSQIQRRGRVGRVRKGIYVQITIDKNPPTKYTQPAIVSNDISSSILDFKSIGIDFEKIDNLPFPGISRECMNKYIIDLQKINALDSENNLTRLGNELASFPTIAPFISSSILSAVNIFLEKKKEKKEKEKKIAKIVGALIFLICCTNNLVNDPTSDCFRENFCEDSDIITLLRSITEVKQKEDHLRNMLENSGFNATHTLRLIGTIEQIINIIYENDDKYQSVWTDIKKFISSNDMMEFIRLFFKSIKNKNKKWIQYRKAKYVSVVNVLVDPNFIYQLDNSEYVRIRKRPGGKGFAAPGLCFIMQIECHNDNTFHGSLIHRDNDIENHEICHPKIFVTSNFMNNVFTVPLIEGYIENNRKDFKQFQKSYNYNQECSYINGLSCYYEQYEDKTIISYVTNAVDDKVSEKLMETAIKKVEKIIPYSPRTILVRNDVLKAIVAVTNIGANNFTSKVILYTDVNPIPYQVNKVTIDYLIDHIKELNSVDDHLVVAITGENFSYLTEDEFNVFPNTSPGKPCVFMENSNFYSHLVIISNRAIPNAKSIRWVDSKIHVTYSDVDALVQASNTIFRGIVQVSHDDDMIYTMNKEGQVIYDQKAKQNKIFNLDFRDMTQRSNVFRPIGCMFDRFAMKNIAGNKLIKNIDLLGFRLSIPNKCIFEDKVIKVISLFRRNGQNIDPYDLISQISDSIININPEEIKQDLKILYSKINDVKQERDILYQEYNEPGTNKQLNKRKQENCKKQIKDLYEQVNMKKEQEQTYEQFIKQFCNDNVNCFNSLIELKSISPRNSDAELKRLSKDYYLEFECNVDDREALISTIKQITKLEPEVIPICTITINHDQTSNLNKNQFEQKIKEICSKFGAVVKEEFDYQTLEKGYKGYKKIIIYTGEFSIPFAGEIRNAFGKIDKVQFKFPSKIIPSCLLNRLNVIQCIDNWISDNKLHFQKSGFKYYGNSNEISKAMILLSKKETQPKIPFISHTIPGGIEIEKIVTSINQMNCKFPDELKWGISRSSRLIYTPEDIDSETVRNFILKSSNKTTKKNVHKHEDGNNAIFDYSYYCEEKAVLSGCQIPIYQQDGTVQMKNYCITCGYDLFKNEVDRLFDAEEDMPKLDLLAENIDLIKFIPILEDENVHELWPQVPLGQLLWSLISEPSMNSVTKTWFSAIVYQALHCSQYLDYCPDHPSILLRVTGNQMKCSHPGCKMFLCNECKKWHKPGQCNKKMILPPGYRVCPWCKRAIEKTEACNRIACKCGKYFCYYCGFKGNTSNEIYEHLKTEHDGYFKNPPDYKKYYLHEKVTIKELNEFYKKYPHIKALSSDIVK